MLAIAAPFLFSFDSNAAMVFWVLLGGAIIVLAALTTARPASSASLPVDSHVVLDFVIAMVLDRGPVPARLLGRRRAPTAFFVCCSASASWR